jgi:hypothetical protein
MTLIKTRTHVFTTYPKTTPLHSEMTMQIIQEYKTKTQTKSKTQTKEQQM